MDRAGAVAVAVVTALLLAGCSGADVPGAGGGRTTEAGTTTTAASADPTVAAGAATATPNDRGGETATASATTGAGTRTGEPVRTTADGSAGVRAVESRAATGSDNPWDAAEITVGVDVRADTDRDFTALVRRAVEYWNTEGRAYGAYDVRYEVDPHAASPEIEVRFVKRIEQCGYEQGERLLGCAPRLDAGSDPPPTVPVRIETGYSDASTVRTLKHELGHTRGLGHDDEPAFMNATGVAYTLPRRDAEDRAYPWRTSNFTVYVDGSNVSAADRPAFRRQVDHALDYYEGAPPTVPANVSYTLVDDPAEANIVIRYVDDVGGDPGSGTSMRGIDTDGDGVLEHRTRATIRLRGLDVDRTGYHTGYWLGRLLGASDESELPPPFRGGTDPTGEWWEEGEER